MLTTGCDWLYVRAVDAFTSVGAVVGLGLLVLVVRTFVLLRSAGAIAGDHDALVSELGRSDPSRVIGLVEGFESAGYAEVALAVLARAREIAGATREEARSEIADALAEAERAQTRRVASTRARDLVVLAALVGLVAYVARAGHASTPFFALTGSSALILIAGLVARGAILSRIAARRTALLDAVVEHALARVPASPSGPCPECDGTEYFSVAHPERIKSDGAAQLLGVRALHICRRCGALRGHADPDAIAVGESTDTVLCASPTDDPEALDSNEHEG